MANVSTIIQKDERSEREKKRGRMKTYIKVTKGY